MQSELIKQMFELLGWASFVLIMGSYILVVLGKLKPESKTYPAMGLIGAVCGLASSLYISSMVVVYLNAAWIVISTLAILGISLPKIITSMRGFWSGYVIFFLLLIAVSITKNDNFIIKDYLNTVGLMANYTFVASYLLFTQLKINQKTLYLLSIKGQFMLMPILFIHGNYPILMIQIFGAIFSVIGLSMPYLKIISEKVRLRLSNAS